MMDDELWMMDDELWMMDLFNPASWRVGGTGDKRIYCYWIPAGSVFNHSVVVLPIMLCPG